MEIRRAQVEDALAIAKVHIESWQAASLVQFPHEPGPSVDVSNRARYWSKLLASSTRSTFVATVDEDVAGFCCLAPSQDDDAANTVGEILTLFVLPSHWRKGIGRSLWERVLLKARKSAFEELTLWVHDFNRRAIQFYETLGFRPDGKTKIFAQQGEHTIYELRYRLDISGKPN